MSTIDEAVALRERAQNYGAAPATVTLAEAELNWLSAGAGTTEEARALYQLCMALSGEIAELRAQIAALRAETAGTLDAHTTALERSAMLIDGITTRVIQHDEAINGAGPATPAEPITAVEWSGPGEPDWKRTDRELAKAHEIGAPITPAERAAIGRTVAFLRARAGLLANSRSVDPSYGDAFRSARDAVTDTDLALLARIAEGGRAMTTSDEFRRGYDAGFAAGYADIASLGRIADRKAVAR